MTIVHNSTSSRALRSQAELAARRMLQINSEGICLIAIKGSWRKGLCFKPELQGDIYSPPPRGEGQVCGV